jgi:hypothetical protein
MATKHLNHSCPVCGHPVGAKRWFWRSWIWARWRCVSCDTLLRFDFRQRLRVGLFHGLFLALLMVFAAMCLFFHLSPLILVPLFLIYTGATTFVFVRYDRIIAA